MDGAASIFNLDSNRLSVPPPLFVFIYFGLAPYIFAFGQILIAAAFPVPLFSPPIASLFNFHCC